MKLAVLFIVMDLLTILAYPFAFVHARLYPLEILNTQKKGSYA